MNLNLIFDRAKKLLLNPKEAWQDITKEGHDPKDVINYVAVLLLLPASALFLGYGVIGLPSSYGYFRMPLLSAFFSAFVFYFLSATAVAVTGLMISFFSNYFSVDGKFGDYLKLAGYSATAPILANIIYLLPIIKFLKIIGFLGTVTLFVGIQIVLKIPKEKEMQFVVTVLIAAIIIAVIFAGLTDQFLGPIYSEIL